MKIPIDWLAEFVDIDESAQSLSEKLLMHGLECHVVSDKIIEAEVLPNRGDCLSIIGIAREVCALNNKPLKYSEKDLKETGENTTSLLNIEVKDKDLCQRYCAAVIKNVKIEPSPSWITDRLAAAGMRPINNIVDATNYVMLESGQPLHAFDLDKIKDKKIIIRRAEAGEKIQTLDKVVRELTKDILVISDQSAPLAVAGIMGGNHAEVSSATKNIILESAYFDSIAVNNASKILKLRTESSHRFEKGTDFGSVRKYLNRLLDLILTIVGGDLASGVIDIKSAERNPKVIDLRLGRIKKILGQDVPKENVLSILTGLGFDTKESEDIIKVKIPLFREKDIEREIDLIEEIARIWGYEKIAETFPCSLNLGAADSRTNKLLDKENDIRNILNAGGFFEAVTYSMLDEKLLKMAGITSDNCIKITNPLIEEMTHLRPSLLPGLLSALEYNLNRKTDNVALFEIGKIFFCQNGEEQEESCLAGIFSGSLWTGLIDKNRINEDFYYLKGIVENILNIYCGTGVVWKAINKDDAFFEAGKAARIFHKDILIGYLGQAGKNIKNNFSCPKDIYVFELNLDILNSIVPPERTFSPISKFPSVSRDIAMFIPESLTHKEIVDCILSNGAPLAGEVELFDRFKGKNKISLAYSVKYKSKEKTLTDDEINAVHNKVLKALVEKLNVEIR